MLKITRRCHIRYWHAINRILALTICVAGFTVVGLHFIPILDKTRELEEVIKQRQRELRGALLLQERREREVALLRSDPVYLETIARDKLELMQPGETIFRLDGKIEKLHLPTK